MTPTPEVASVALALNVRVVSLKDAVTVGRSRSTMKGRVWVASVCADVVDRYENVEVPAAIVTGVV